MNKRQIATAATLGTCLVFAGMASVTGGFGIKGSAGAGTPSLPSPRSPRPVLPATIDIVGRVDGQGVGATAGTITVRVGETATAAAGAIEPQFQATVAGTRPQDMVSVEIEGQDFKFVSTLGSYGRLVQLAGTDRVLTLEESDALAASPFSTALHFFVNRHLGGAPLSDTQHENAWRAVIGGYGVGLDTATTLLGRFATGELTLPPGYPHGYALLQDRDAYRAFVSESPSALEGYLDDLLALNSTAMTDRDLGSIMAVLGPVKDTEVPMFDLDAEILERTTAGYRVHARDSRRNPDFSGGLDSEGRLQLTPDNEIYSETFLGQCSNGNWVTQRTTLLGQSHRLQRRGIHSNLWMTVKNYVNTYSDCPDFPVTEFKEVSFGVVRDPTTGASSGMARRFSGIRGLPYICHYEETEPWPDLLTQCEYATHSFNQTGTGEVTGLGSKVDSAMRPVAAAGIVPFSWVQTTRSSLRVQYPTVSVRYWLVDQGNDAVTGLVFVAEVLDGQNTITLAGYTAMLNGNAPAGFESFSPVGTWKYATFEGSSEPYAYDEGTEVPMARFVRAGNGDSVRQLRYQTYPQFNSDTRSSWTLFAGSLYDARIFHNRPGGQYHDCKEAYAAGATQCAPNNVRYFRPLTRIGNRLYGIEDLYTNSTFSWQPPFQISRFSRPTYYERE